MRGTWIGFRAGGSGADPSVRIWSRNARARGVFGRTRGQGIRLEVSG